MGQVGGLENRPPPEPVVREEAPPPREEQPQRENAEVQAAVEAQTNAELGVGGNLDITGA